MVSRQRWVGEWPRVSRILRLVTENTPPLVLVVEDHEDSREMLLTLLEAAGFRGVGAESADRGLALIGEEAPAVIVTDIAMPGTDGWTFLERLKGDEATKHIPVMVLTGHAGDAHMKKSLAAGATYFTKPLQADELLREIRYLAYTDPHRDRRSGERRE